VPAPFLSEAQVSDTSSNEPLFVIGNIDPRRAERVRQIRETFGGDRSQDRTLVGEVAVGRVVADLGALGDLAKVTPAALPRSATSSITASSAGSSWAFFA
jgi:hypothetical protein